MMHRRLPVNTSLPRPEPLPERFNYACAATIKPVDFLPSAMPSDDEKRALAEASAFKSRAPVRGGRSLRIWGPPSWRACKKCSARRSKLLTNCTAHGPPCMQTSSALPSGPEPTAAAHRIHCRFSPYQLLLRGAVQYAGLAGPLLVRPCIGGVIVKALEKDRYYRMNPVREQ